MIRITFIFPVATAQVFTVSSSCIKEEYYWEIYIARKKSLGIVVLNSLCYCRNRIHDSQYSVINLT